MHNPEVSVRNIDIVVTTDEEAQSPYHKESFSVAFDVFVNESPINARKIKLSFTGPLWATSYTEILSKIKKHAEDIKSEYILREQKGFNL